MEIKKTIDANMTVRELLDDYPQAGKVFVEGGLLCFGCPTESFHTLSDVAREYQLNLNDLLKRIQESVQRVEAE